MEAPCFRSYYTRSAGKSLPVFGRGEGDMLPSYTMDVMALTTALRREWGVVYPEEEIRSKTVGSGLF